jgi:hypothetical protein
MGYIKIPAIPFSVTRLVSKSTRWHSSANQAKGDLLVYLPKVTVVGFQLAQ